jgi:hypothetical protein
MLECRLAIGCYLSAINVSQKFLVGKKILFVLTWQLIWQKRIAISNWKQFEGILIWKSRIFILSLSEAPSVRIPYWLEESRFNRRLCLFFVFHSRVGFITFMGGGDEGSCLNFNCKYRHGIVLTIFKLSTVLA